VARFHRKGLGIAVGANVSADVGSRTDPVERRTARAEGSLSGLAAALRLTADRLCLGDADAHDEAPPSSARTLADELAHRQMALTALLVSLATAIDELRDDRSIEGAREILRQRGRHLLAVRKALASICLDPRVRSGLPPFQRDGVFAEYVRSLYATCAVMAHALEEFALSARAHVPNWSRLRTRVEGTRSLLREDLEAAIRREWARARRAEASDAQMADRSSRPGRVSVTPHMDEMFRAAIALSRPVPVPVPTPRPQLAVRAHA
jgi:hypothetical protein